jgi:hypothetical protein
VVVSLKCPVHPRQRRHPAACLHRLVAGRLAEGNPVAVSRVAVNRAAVNRAAVNRAAVNRAVANRAVDRQVVVSKVAASPAVANQVVDRQVVVNPAVDPAAGPKDPAAARVVPAATVLAKLAVFLAVAEVRTDCHPRLAKPVVVAAAVQATVVLVQVQKPVAVMAVRVAPMVAVMVTASRVAIAAIPEHYLAVLAAWVRPVSVLAAAVHQRRTRKSKQLPALKVAVAQMAVALPKAAVVPKAVADLKAVVRRVVVEPAVEPAAQMAATVRLQEPEVREVQASFRARAPMKELRGSVRSLMNPLADSMKF